MKPMIMKVITLVYISVVNFDHLNFIFICLIEQNMFITGSIDIYRQVIYQ